MSVSSITASSISLSWNVASGSVASWEVVWRETDRGTESSSGSLTGTRYTIDQLESTTIYTVTVRASNVAGTTDSQPITFSTGECVATPASSIINPRCACAARVTVLALCVSLSVCVSICYRSSSCIVGFRGQQTASAALP